MSSINSVWFSHVSFCHVCWTFFLFSYENVINDTVLNNKGVKNRTMISGGQGGDAECFKQFNSKGSINGHCGVDENKQFIKCDAE